MNAREEPGWLTTLRAASSGKSEAGVEVARGTRPPLLAADGVHALTSALFAALVVAAALFRTQLTQTPFDLIALLLRTAGVAFVLRTLVALVRLARRLARDRHAHRQLLAWSRDGLLWQTAEGERWVARGDVLGVAAPEERAGRMAGALAPLYVVLRPQMHPLYWELPPYFASSAAIVQARLERWLKDRPHAEQPQAPQGRPEERYSRAATGRAAPGDVVVPEGFGYRLRAPYGVLLALLFVGDALRTAGVHRERLLPAAVAAALLALTALLGWFAWMRKRRAARLGIALLLTPEELLVQFPSTRPFSVCRRRS
jgi:hypothetical protein